MTRAERPCSFANLVRALYAARQQTRVERGQSLSGPLVLLPTPRHGHQPTQAKKPVGISARRSARIPEEKRDQRSEMARITAQLQQRQDFFADGECQMPFKPALGLERIERIPIFVGLS